MINESANKILTPNSKLFLNSLYSEFNEKIVKLLEQRKEFYHNLQQKSRLKIDPPTPKSKDDWKCTPPPEDILDRRVEITGPPSRKMIINALNSGANVYMCDFEDSNSPTWDNCINGQINLYDAVRKTITYTNQKKKYTLESDTAVLFVRPRGLHLEEKNYLVGDDRIRACLFDFGLYFFHNYKELLKNGTRPYFYLPKLEHPREARLWTEIFNFAEKYVEIPSGTIRATVLVETFPAVLQMDEILYELREHSAGLNCGRWDYIFSFIKTFQHDKNYVLPDRSMVDMGSHFMKSYSQLLIRTCHHRGVHAIGGMAAQIPIGDDPEANDIAMRKVKADKLREVQDGHDGTWVAHPFLVHIAKSVFDEHMPTFNQIDIKSSLNRDITISDLIIPPIGDCTEQMLRENINIIFLYISSWIKGNGCVPINYLMEDAATAEISRAQIWQWIKHEIVLSNRVVMNKAYFNQVLREESRKYEKNKNFETIFNLIKDMCMSDNLKDFLTLECYEIIE
jgi:malate synthase